MRLTTPREIGLLVREQRRLLGLSQHDLADRVGASRQWVQNLEAGKPGLELGLTLRALTALGVQIDARPPAGNLRPGSELPTIHAESNLFQQRGTESLIDTVIAQHRAPMSGARKKR
jgi:transcriptional regulator with XRE-family HTH domain